jgi:hypothetical protein
LTLCRCKSIEDLQADAGSHGLRRALGPLHLVLFGIGCILGAGIYVLPGTAAANFAGPAVIVSFVLAGGGILEEAGMKMPLIACAAAARPCAARPLPEAQTRSVR